MEALPVAAQLAPVFGMVTEDADQDGNLDIVMAGNDFGNEVTNGRYDAFNGLLLKGDGKGNFAAQTPAAAGIFLPGDAKALAKLTTTGNNFLLAASENRGAVKVFRNRAPAAGIMRLTNNDRYALITLSNGQTRREELYYGCSFLSQSARFISTNPHIKK